MEAVEEMDNYARFAAASGRPSNVLIRSRVVKEQRFRRNLTYQSIFALSLFKNRQLIKSSRKTILFPLLTFEQNSFTPFSQPGSSRTAPSFLVQIEVPDTRFEKKRVLLYFLPQSAEGDHPPLPGLQHLEFHHRPHGEGGDHCAAFVDAP
jgi:hypothetical protein